MVLEPKIPTKIRNTQEAIMVHWAHCFLSLIWVNISENEKWKYANRFEELGLLKLFIGLVLK